ncbi:MAG: hypothetical protein FH759_10840 [Sediminimonas qiaohouensis]|uniref:Uncharacterized protein n=1 Tax=Sediminimonas qiaohouensis TaxID=552061 RepID=A0A7C9HBK5_9RHOB|nr:hypothetical protein [Sediminimonas qiaohouensis]MTJ05170.1 hypothetical protein [Sediminimonas qiaohouensis]
MSELFWPSDAQMPLHALIGRSLLLGGFSFARFWVPQLDRSGRVSMPNRRGTSAAVGLARPRQGTAL